MKPFEQCFWFFHQDSVLDWFPRLRAMSLAAIDGDGEQIELRSLQLNLESTQALVSKLSVQLMELKDQVYMIATAFFVSTVNSHIFRINIDDRAEKTKTTIRPSKSYIFSIISIQ